MVGKLSPILSGKLDKIDKDANTDELSMESPKSYLKDLASEGISQFLAQILEAKDAGSLSRQCAFSICEDLVRVHGPNIVPQIDNIMSTVIKSLTSSSKSFSVQQACSKVVLSIARYGIDPLTPADKKKEIVHSICKPLSDSLLGSKESLASGAALCLQALLDSNNWKYASDEIVDEICLNVAAALEEKPKQSDSHMGLVMALAKHNGLIIEAYARLLIRSGLQILNIGIIECNSHKQFSAIQMVNFLMKCVDASSILSDLENVSEEMEKCHADVDQMSSVRHAAFEALQTARTIIWEKCTCMGLSCNGPKTYSEHFKYSDISNNVRDHLDAFSRFGHAYCNDKLTRSATPILERPRSQLKVNDIDILATPRKSIFPIQDPNGVNSNLSKNQKRRIRKRSQGQLKQILGGEVNGNCQKGEFNHDRSPENRNQAHGSESASSIDDVASNVVAEEAHYAGPQIKNEIPSPNVKDRSLVKVFLYLVCSLLIIFSIAASLLVLIVDDEEMGFHVAPT